jgi:hypothetical protein
VDAKKVEEMNDHRSVDEEEVVEAVEEIVDAVVAAVEIEDAVVAVEIEEEAAVAAISRDRRRSNGTSKNHVKRLLLSNPRRENERKKRPWIRLKLRFNAAFIPSSEGEYEDLHGTRAGRLQS